ncbi:PREDICTED: uncharacterized protein LOC104725308 [Camelina sativa]|uniref:Uncharacterized protein LOC104725308 n=1 Tax=Camelina sativa TaxID=90675 RepID=A0ABM0UJY5_CAMSA|nr:PREDICTED: uncharacterized protein LOC104725308 [Camelina sativa]
MILLQIFDETKLILVEIYMMEGKSFSRDGWLQPSHTNGWLQPSHKARKRGNIRQVLVKLKWIKDAKDEVMWEDVSKLIEAYPEVELVVEDESNDTHYGIKYHRRNKKT